MKILVTGKEGQLARALAEAGAAVGFDISLAGRTDCDIRDRDAVEATIVRVSPEVVVNTAAFTSVDRAESDPDEAFAVNATGAANVACACAGADIPLIHISTDYVFDGRKTTAYLEDDQTAPLNVYGRSKLEGEREVARHCRRPLILRTGWLYSPWGNNFLKTMLSLAAGGETIDVVNDQHGCPTYAPHLAEAILEISSTITQKPSDMVFGTYHVTGQGETVRYNFAEEIFRQSTKFGLKPPVLRPIETAQYATTAARPANSRLDCTKLQQAFGIALPAWQTGVMACLERVDVVPTLGAMERTR